MKQRLLLSLLSVAALIYVALPKLPVYGSVPAVLFSVVWLGCCVLAFGGNFASLLYGSKMSKHPYDGKREEARPTRERETGI